MHPGFYIGEAVDKGGVSCSGDRCGGDVKRYVIGIAMEAETMMAYNVAKGEKIEDEKQWTKHRTLGDALGQRSS